MINNFKIYEPEKIEGRECFKISLNGEFYVLVLERDRRNTGEYHINHEYSDLVLSNPFRALQVFGEDFDKILAFWKFVNNKLSDCFVI